jgi:hypothetical protein
LVSKGKSAATSKFAHSTQIYSKVAQAGRV